MKLREATKEQRTAVMQLMLPHFLGIEKALGVRETDEMHVRWRKAIEALPELGDDLWKVNPELRAAAELCLNRMFPNAVRSTTEAAHE